MWRCHPNQLYVVEVTLPNSQMETRQSEKKTLNILDLLPCVSCLSPKDVLNKLNDDEETGKSMICVMYEFIKKLCHIIEA